MAKRRAAAALYPSSVFPLLQVPEPPGPLNWVNTEEEARHLLYDCDPIWQAMAKDILDALEANLRRPPAPDDTAAKLSK